MGRAKFCVFIGRFQPLHRAHLKIIEQALETEADQLVLVVGSYRTPRSLKNPWSFEERKQMILSSLKSDHARRTFVVPARDYLYSDITWLTGIQNAIANVVGAEKSVKIIGHFKDDSSYYLKLFPQWDLIQQPNFFGANSTDIRTCLFEKGVIEGEPASFTPEAVADTLHAYAKTDAYQNMVAEHEFLKRYKERWSSAPFPPVFVTTDAVVVQAGHVLLVTRKMNPGKGMYALPGGFLQKGQRLLDSCLRELKEETDILFPKDDLKLSVKDSHVFDHPYRDARGRTITHAFYFHIDQLGPLPTVVGGDDAATASWVPLSDLALLEESFYSDHLHIINYFVSGVGR